MALILLIISMGILVYWYTVIRPKSEITLEEDIKTYNTSEASKSSPQKKPKIAFAVPKKQKESSPIVRKKTGYAFKAPILMDEENEDDDDEEEKQNIPVVIVNTVKIPVPKLKPKPQPRPALNEDLPIMETTETVVIKETTNDFIKEEANFNNKKEPKAVIGSVEGLIVKVDEPEENYTDSRRKDPKKWHVKPVEQRRENFNVDSDSDNGTDLSNTEDLTPVEKQDEDDDEGRIVSIPSVEFISHELLDEKFDETNSKSQDSNTLQNSQKNSGANSKSVTFNQKVAKSVFEKEAEDADNAENDE